jgi:hypothetical protein
MNAPLDGSTGGAWIGDVGASGPAPAAQSRESWPNDGKNPLTAAAAAVRHGPPRAVAKGPVLPGRQLVAAGGQPRFFSAS